MKQIQGAEVDAYRDGAVRCVGVGPQLGQPDQHAEEPVGRGIEVARALAKVRVVELREGRANLLERTRDRPLRPEALVVDEPPGLARELGAADDQTMKVDDLDPGPARNAAELPAQPFELLFGHLGGRLETGELGLAIVAQDPPLGDGYPDLGQVRRPDGDAPRRPHPVIANHRLTAWTGSLPLPAWPDRK